MDGILLIHHRLHRMPVEYLSQYNLTLQKKSQNYIKLPNNTAAILLMKDYWKNRNTGAMDSKF